MGELQRFEAGEILIQEGEVSDHLGSATLGIACARAVLNLASEAVSFSQRWALH